MNLADVGQRAKRRRLELGLGQEDVAERIGRTRGYVSRFEAGKSGESLRDTIELARALGVKLSDLVGETDEELLSEVRRQRQDGSELAISFERIVRAHASQAASDQEFIRRAIDALADLYEHKASAPDQTSL